MKISKRLSESERVLIDSLYLAWPPSLINSDLVVDSLSPGIVIELPGRPDLTIKLKDDCSTWQIDRVTPGNLRDIFTGKHTGIYRCEVKNSELSGIITALSVIKNS